MWQSHETGAVIRTIRTTRLKSTVAACFALAAVAGAGTSANAQPQTDPAAIVQSQENQSAGLAATWLSSGDARTRAWGAYLALRDRRRELLPQLIGLAEAYAVKSGPLSSTERNEHDAMLGALDAVIQMDGKISPDEAAKLYPEFPVQALIFLSRGGPAASSFLLNIFREENSHTLAWLAAGDLLALRPDPNLRAAGFAAAVLGGLTVDAEVRVVDEGSGPRRGRGVGGSCPFTPPSPWPVGWPPIASYFFGFIDRSSVLLAAGADPSLYTRAAGKAVLYTEMPPCEWLKPNRDVVREHFLANLAEEPTGNPSVRSTVETTITWRNNAQYLRDLRAFTDQEQDLFDKLSAKLMAAGPLSAEERASVRPSLLVRISDDRSKKPSSLPVVQNTESNVKIVN